ncbi:MAG: DNA polymerase I, partial [Planctomycetaceae bacterium]|nr:DNA polymerase I [Planctomycetaceae bacterium]
QQLFLDYGFRKFRDELYDLAGLNADPDTPAEQPVVRKTVQRRLFDSPNSDVPEKKKDKPAEPIKHAPLNESRNWTVIRDEEQLEELLASLSKLKELCIDLETTSVDAMQAQIVGWAVSGEPGTAAYIPVDGPAGSSLLDADLVLERFRPLLESDEIEISNQNIKYDAIVWKCHGLECRNIGMDPMVGHYLLDAGARSHGLDALADEFLGHRMIPISDLIGTGKNQKKMNEVDVDTVGEYAAEDADIALQLSHILRAELERQELWQLYADLERPLIPILAEMEFTGIKVNAEELFDQSRVAGQRIEELMQELEQLAGRSFNPDSPKQLRELLFDELGLPVQKRTKTGASTDQAVLEKLATLHPLPAKIIEYRQMAKLKGTYLDALPKLVHPKTGRIHASFNQVVAATGRLSSSDPNLQNIPIRTPEGRMIRKAFIPGQKDWKL